MDPITLGTIGLGVAGGSLITVAIAEKAGFKINTMAIQLFLEATKYGGLLYLLHHVKDLFF